MINLKSNLTAYLYSISSLYVKSFSRRIIIYFSIDYKYYLFNIVFIINDYSDRRDGHEEKW